MRIFKRIISAYFNSWWIPVMIAALMLVIAVIFRSIEIFMILLSGNVPWRDVSSPTLSLSAFLLGLSSFGILTAALSNFIEKRWGIALINLLMVPVIVIAVGLSILLYESIIQDLKCESLRLSDWEIPADRKEEPKDRTEIQQFDPVRVGNPEMFLVKGDVPYGGVYDVYAYLNPGEQGTVYLEVFQPTKNWRLRVFKDSFDISDDISEGWSDNPKQQFLYHIEMRAVEGCLERYPARLELWFAHESGYPRRKLLEKIFIIDDIRR